VGSACLDKKAHRGFESQLSVLRMKIILTPWLFHGFDSKYIGFKIKGLIGKIITIKIYNINKISYKY
jgi:hypothetical protein